MNGKGDIDMHIKKNIASMHELLNWHVIVLLAFSTGLFISVPIILFVESVKLTPTDAYRFLYYKSDWYSVKAV